MAEYRIEHRMLALTADPVSCQYSVTLPNGALWRMTQRPYIRFADGRVAAFPAPVREERSKSGTYDGVRAVYEGFSPGAELSVATHVWIDRTTGDLFFEVRVDGDRMGEIEAVSFPAPFDFGALPGHGYTVLSRMQGTLVPAGETIRIANGEIFERDGYMPLYGQVRDGSGYAAIYDTPYDAKYALEEDRVVPLWRPSLGEMRYARRMLFRFREGCDHSAIAKCYRAYVKERGQLVTLREKIARNPALARLPGCAVIHEGIAVHISPKSDYYTPGEPEKNDYYTSFDERAAQLRALRARGLEKGYTHFDGWGYHGYDNLHPSPFPPNEAAGGAAGMRRLSETTRELGYLFGIHDQYRDYYHDGPDFSFDEAVTNMDGSHPYCSVWYGGPHSFLCSARAADYVRRNYAEFERLGIGIDGSYLDVFSVVNLDECFSKEHPTTREQCAQNRRRCLDILTDRGIIPSSEEVLDCILPSQALCHHAPFYTTELGAKDARAVGVPIPLLNLVYHDCVVIPWIGLPGQRGGWGIPGADCAYTHAILNGDPVYCPIGADEAQVAAVKAACESAERLACQEMLRHEFVDGDFRRQRTTFADGTVIEVDFNTEEYRITTP
ncbi:MAG: hypothetical protein J5602_03810 [Clostridia bacterium]|nr:hypothetical protein [Clostridia bacterium]MBO4884419.1 hypothetical protein [Clostridia bacterium]